MLTDFEQKELERLKSLTGVHTMSGEDIDLMLKAINLPIEKVNKNVKRSKTSRFWIRLV